MDITLINNSQKVRVEMWFSTPKMRACIRTLCSHIKNMFTGVTKKFQYKMRFVYAHFPINSNIIDGGNTIEIRNFMGEKRVRTVRVHRVCVSHITFLPMSNYTTMYMIDLISDL